MVHRLHVLTNWYDRPYPKPVGNEFARMLDQKRSNLLRELEKLRSEQAETTQAIQVRESQLKYITELLALEDGRSSDNVTEVAIPKGAPFLAAAVELLGKVGKPMHYRQLAETLSRQDVYVPGRDPAANLLAHMSRDARFRRFDRGTYGLQHWRAGRSAKDAEPRGVEGDEDE